MIVLHYIQYNLDWNPRTWNGLKRSSFYRNLSQRRSLVRHHCTIFFENRTLYTANTVNVGLTIGQVGHVPTASRNIDKGVMLMKVRRVWCNCIFATSYAGRMRYVGRLNKSRNRSIFERRRTTNTRFLPRRPLPHWSGCEKRAFMIERGPIISLPRGPPTQSGTGCCKQC